MIEFMLSRDERVRPDWVDLEEHVMKGGDEGKRSFIQDDRNNSVMINNSQIGNTNRVSTGSARPSVELGGFRNSNLVGNQNDRRSNSPVVARQLSPRGPSMPLPGHNTFNPASVISYQNKESPRNSQPVNQFPKYPSFQAQGPPSSFQPYSQPQLSILKPSNIDFTRPTRNIFPADSYTIKTKIDENLIMV